MPVQPPVALRVNSAGRRRRRIAESYDKEWYGARDRDVVIDDGCKGRVQCLSTEQVRLFVYYSSSSIPSYIDHSRSIFFFISELLFFLIYWLSLLGMFLHSPAFTAQRSNSSNSPSSPQLLRLSRRDSSHHLMCLLCRTSFRRRRRFNVQPSTSPQQRFHLLSTSFEFSNYVHIR